jgi:hypothetical protein
MNFAPPPQGRREKFVSGGAGRNIWRPFFRTQTNLQNSRPKKILRLFFSKFSHFFHTPLTTATTEPSNPLSTPLAWVPPSPLAPLPPLCTESARPSATPRAPPPRLRPGQPPWSPPPFLYATGYLQRGCCSLYTLRAKVL